MRTSGTARFALLLGFLSITAIRVDAQWPQFRGPEGNGTTSSTKLPLTWSEESNVRWKTEIHGKAWSSPVVIGGQVWLSTATPDGRELSALALDVETGKIIHDLKLFKVENPKEGHPFNSYASPTPVAEPGRVYITFGSPGTVAIDTRTGKVLWERRDLECDHFRGAGSSPILFRNLLIMHFDGIDVQYVVALDKNTGQTVWKTPRSIDFKDLDANGKPTGDGDFRKAFSTPHIVEVGGQPLLVSVGGKATYGYDPMTGKERWRVEERRSHTASTRPVNGLGMVFYPTGWESTQLLAIRPDGAGDVTATHVVWRLARVVPNKPSILFVDGLIYMINDTGIASCVDAKTGTLVWQSRVAGMFSASPLYAAGRIYLFDEDGKTTVLEAGREFKVLAENLLDNGFMASPAVVGDALILRTSRDLYRIEQSATR
jgi:outer membrane protein assembly factor BamB